MNNPWEGGRPWKETGAARMSAPQRRLLNAACTDLSRHLSWHGFRLSSADYRHLLSGTVLGWRTLPAWDNGDGMHGVIMLGGSSLNLRKSECTDCITMAFLLGDDPSTQGMDCKPVKWSALIKAARGIRDSEEDL